MPDEVSLAQQQVAPHGFEVVHELVLGVKDLQQVLTCLLVHSVNHLLEDTVMSCWNMDSTRRKIKL